VQPKHILTGRDELLGLIKEKECGLPVEDIKDAYPSVLEDLQVQYFESLLNYANQFCD
jgi:transcription initiation factor TFIIE subunit beta